MSEAGKGDKPRIVDGIKFRENFDLIFLKKEGLSIIVPIKNRTEVITEEKGVITPFLHNVIYLRDYEYMYDIQLIVVDYHSTDSDMEWVHDYIKDCKIVRPDLGSKWDLGSARNLGVQHCKYENLFFLDADMIILRDDVFNLGINHLNDNRSFFPVCREILWDNDRKKDYDGEWIDVAYGNAFMTKKMFNKVGGYFSNVTWGKEDSDMFKRHLSAGLRPGRERVEGFRHQWHPKDLCFKYYET